MGESRKCRRRNWKRPIRVVRRAPSPFESCPGPWDGCWWPTRRWAASFSSSSCDASRTSIASLLGSGSSPMSVGLSQPSMCWRAFVLRVGAPLARVGTRSWASRKGSRTRGVRPVLPGVDRCHFGGSSSEHSSFEHGAIEGWSQQMSGTHSATPRRVPTGAGHCGVYGNPGRPAPPRGPYPVAGLHGRFLVRRVWFPRILSLVEVRDSG